MPLGSTRNHNLPFNRRLAALAPRTKEFMVVQMAVEPQPLIAIFVCTSPAVIVTRYAITDAINTVQAVGLGFRIEGDAFETFAAVVAAEALRVETRAGGGDNAACNGEGAVLA